MLVANSVYSPTRRFCDTTLKQFGVDVEYYDPLVGAGIAGLMKPNTRLILTESFASGTFEIQDIPAIVTAAHAGGAIVVMDNTWATPVYFRALDYGVDITVHAATNLSGRPFRPLARSGLRQREVGPGSSRLSQPLGICAGPDDVYQVLRGCAA